MGYVAVIGAGSWGTTLASLLCEKGYDVSLWSFEPEVAEEIRREGANTSYLPDVRLPENLRATTDMEDAVRKARYIVNVVPTQFVRPVFSDAVKYIHEDAIIISASKGIEHGTLMTVSQILNELTGSAGAVLSGPSFAKEVIKRFPTAVTLASRDPETGLLLQELFNTQYFRVYTHTDMLGVELGGALKNVIAIASGICDGLGLGHNARAALITRGLVEMSRLGEHMGADKRTFSGLSGLGDLVLTCTGPLSRNYSVGFKLGQGLKLGDILSSTKSVAEGVATALSAFELGARYSAEMPIVEQVYKVIYKEKSPAKAVNMLMNRTLKSEF
ncbi:MAG: NAD(P)-dependent glycerol-3-phosphate dehydrogenase [Nitrospiraceae bacterium]|nr:NAD(P)-dependent glycerol-3-phosphate dehydrogenase [Nitrospiraceae bacterium]